MLSVCQIEIKAMDYTKEVAVKASRIYCMNTPQSNKKKKTFQPCES